MPAILFSEAVDSYQRDESDDMSERFDLMVIGGGPAGYLAAERASREGMRVILFERRALCGGE